MDPPPPPPPPPPPSAQAPPVTAPAKAKRAKPENVAHDRFPDELKGRVLGCVQFQVMGRIDALVDLVFERFKDRYFAGEKVFVDLSGDKYFARIARIFPPESIRTLGRQPPYSALAAPLLPPPAEGGPAPPESFDHIAHRVGTNLDAEYDEARKEDDPEDYLYTVQLMDEEHKFEGSFMEVKAKQLSRDRLGFSKSILKRYIRENVDRDASIGSPWIVKPNIAAQFSIPTRQSEESEEKNKKLKEGQLAKRRKTKDEPDATEGPSKKRKTAVATSGIEGAPDAPSPSGSIVSTKPPPPKAIKYPIEDLDLDPMSIHDGRILRRVNTAEIPTLPPKPIPNKHLLVETDLFDTFLATWNALNVFGKPLSIAPFTLDEFAAALNHQTVEPKCQLLAELHASLTNIIGTDTSRVLGSTGATPLFVAAANAAALAAKEGEGEGGGAEEEKDELEEDELEGGGGVEEEEVEGLMGVEEAWGDEELDTLVRKGISHAKRWDRTAKLKSADGREGWERHMIGALCQRGGPHYLPNLTRILKHLFEGADLSPSAIKPLPPTPSLSATATFSSTPLLDAPPSDIDTQSVRDDSNPEAAYLTLSVEDKVDILDYLVTLALGSKAVRGFVDESDAQLTDLRKKRAEVNKERKSLVEQRAALDAQIALAEDLPPPPPSSLLNSSGSTPMEIDTKPSTNGHGHGGSSHDPDSPASSRPRSPSIDGTNGSSGLGSTARRAALEEKKAHSAAKAVEAAKAREASKAKSAGKKEADRLRGELDELVRANELQDDKVEREFRRYLGVSRCRPLGKDRFHCRYWWFDGIGSMEYVSAKGTEVLYDTGRLFVQGPSKEDWEFVKDRGEEGEMEKRRIVEEGGEERVLGVDEWGYYEDAEEIEQLTTWLNSKGTRELALKSALTKWGGWIMAGAQKRLGGAPPVVRSADARRSSRKKDEGAAGSTYLSWVNTRSRY